MSLSENYNCSFGIPTLRWTIQLRKIFYFVKQMEAKNEFKKGVIHRKDQVNGQ